MIDGKTKIIGILGDPIEHSFSPVMHNTAFYELGLNYVYVPFRVLKDNLKEAVEGLKALGVLGANVTIPHKERIIPYLSGISKEAELIGAVNTIVLKEDGFYGENTDGKGFIESLKSEKKFDPKGKKVVILGAGGAARAVAVSLSLAHAEKITIINRTVSKASSIAEVINEKINKNCEVLSYEDDLESTIKDADLIVNTTSLGMHPKIDEMPPINIEYLDQHHLVVDLIYNPKETKLLKLAKEKKCDTLNGLSMLIKQGELSFNMWIPDAFVDFKKCFNGEE